jgi:aminomethyltransferase
MRAAADHAPATALQESRLSPSSPPPAGGAPLASPQLALTPLDALHRELGARMVPFAGYAMPVQYPSGLLAEHHHTRSRAGLFDVSHMGQVRLAGGAAAAALESLVPVDVQGLPPGRQRYAFFTNADGGIDDDLMIVRLAADELLLVVNAACKAADLALLQAGLAGRCVVEPLPERALLALQGPQAAAVLARLAPQAAAMRFMDACRLELEGAEAIVTRSGYTGEDGFELSVPAERVVALARRLLAEPEVAPIGLGARNSLRLEAGLCLYGNDIDAGTSPVEAGLQWAIQKVRRSGGERAGGFPGAARILAELDRTRPLARQRVGLRALERIPVRDGAVLVDRAGAAELGRVTSGTLAPSADACVAMAYLPPSHAEVGTEVAALVRGKPVPMAVCPMPFVPHRYQR